MSKKKLPQFPHSELEFTKPADQLINIVQQYHVRLYGEKADWQTVLAMCNKILEERK